MLSDSYSFYSSEREVLPTVSNNPDIATSNFYLYFYLESEEVMNTRSVYNVLDFLGDNGGLFDGL